MPALHIRNVDDAVVTALKRRAAAHNRSLEGELREVLEQIAFPRRSLQKRSPGGKLPLKTVNVGAKTNYGRDEIYGDDAR